MSFFSQVGPLVFGGDSSIPWIAILNFLSGGGTGQEGGVADVRLQVSSLKML